MSFTKRDVKDRVVQHPRRYKLNPVSGQTNTYDLEPVPGEITEAGTPINKAYLQPIEDGLNDALEKTGDGKDITVTFTEAATEADIASGEKLSIMFGKILKKFKNIVSGATAVGKAATLDGLLSTITELNFVKGVTSAIQTQLNGKAQTSHASTANTYGLGTAANHGHVKTINDLTQANHVDGTALSAYQGKVLSDRITAEVPQLLYITGTIAKNQANTQIASIDKTKYREVMLTYGEGGAHYYIVPASNKIIGIKNSGNAYSIFKEYTLTTTDTEIIYVTYSNRGTLYAKMSGNNIVFSASGNTVDSPDYQTYNILAK